MAELVKKNVNLQCYNTMALPAIAQHYCAITNQNDLLAALTYADKNSLPVWVLGGGSNVIFTENYSGLLLHIQSSGIELLEESDNEVIVRVAAGENWDEFLQHCLKQGWHGLENLAYIPGTVGAAPVQNIGAYGQDVAQAIVGVHGVIIDSQQEKTYSKQQCQFAYRDSIFKQQLAGKFIISAVDFCLSKNFSADLTYQPLAESLAAIEQPSAAQVRAAVITIRQSKLPSPATIANTGSFFKNPLVSGQQAEQLKAEYPGMPSYPAAGGKVKLAAGWLIEQCGWKGKKLGSVGMYEKQALVLVNHGGATYSDVKALTEQVVVSVQQRFSVQLEQEPVLVSCS